jgi:hypothetical protein
MQRPLVAALLVVSVVLFAGCPRPAPIPDAGPTCDDTFIGDPSLPVEAVLVYTDGVSSTLVDVTAGAAVPLARPPQGGFVSYVGARVRNINRCSVQFRARYRDPATNVELGFDGRNADLVVGADGWGRPDATQLSDLANLPLCPDNDPVRDNQGQPALLEVMVSDQHNHSATVSQMVVPTCAASDPIVQALCLCDCNHAPPAGRMCMLPDGGSP